MGEPINDSLRTEITRTFHATQEELVEVYGNARTCVWQWFEECDRQFREQLPRSGRWDVTNDGVIISGMRGVEVTFKAVLRVADPAEVRADVRRRWAAYR